MADETAKPAIGADSLTNLGQGLFVLERSGRFGVVDRDLQMVVKPVFEDYPDVVEVGRLIAGKVDGRFVLCDWGLHELREYPYDDVATFYDGRSIVSRDGLSGVVNLDGSVHIDLGDCPLHQCLDHVRDIWEVIDETGRCGFLDNMTQTFRWTDYNFLVPLAGCEGYWAGDRNSISMVQADMAILRQTYCDGLGPHVGMLQLVHREGADSWYVRLMGGVLEEITLRRD